MPNSSLYHNEELLRLKHFSTMLSDIGPHSHIDDIKQAIVKGACDTLNTSLVAMFLIGPRTGEVERVYSETMTAELADAFIASGERLLTDAGSMEAEILDCDNADTRSILATPMRSGTGISGAIVGFYQDRQEAIRNQALIEAMAAQASLILSFASIAQQSKGMLDEYATDNHTLSMQASHDGLTGLLNHKTLQQRLSELCVNSRQVFSLVMADVDHFKRYNDTYGHQEGDEALRSVARVLGAKVRQNDLAARYGGEEFALVIRADKKTAIIVADRIRQAIEATELKQGSVTLSMGIAEYPADGSSPAAVIERADKALYEAKAAGRNCVIACDSMRENEPRRAA